jgi:DNA-directed RNA polymerase subunit RPC12/RpoP
MNPTSGIVLKKRPRVKQVLPSQCLACGAEGGYNAKRIVSAVELRGENFNVEHDTMECSHCSHRILSDEQLDSRIRSTVRCYQNRHGFLTADEAISRRKDVGCSTQQAFVDATGGIVSIATLKRIEAGQHAQDRTSDFTLRKAFEMVEEARRSENLDCILNTSLSAPSPIASFACGPSKSGFSWPLAACMTVLAGACVTLPQSKSVKNESPDTIVC